MRELSVFDIIGPIMIGPSSSHTAGALKIARIARMLAKTRITAVRFQLYGSFATTYKGHGTDRALVGGILGYATDDYRIRDSFDWADKAGIDVVFEEMDSSIDVHPNTVDVTVTEEDGTVSMLRGCSVGGGEIEIVRINGEQAINARSIAATLNCSTQPVFSNFSSIIHLYTIKI